jgi:hypothetical protein
MKYLNKLKTVTKVLFIFLLGIISAQVTAPDCECGEPVNVWYKLSTGKDGIQRTIKLDMQAGVSYSDGPYIILELKEATTGEVIFIAFPNGGVWESETPKDKDPFLEALDEEFKNLEDYLRSKESQEIKKKQ